MKFNRTIARLVPIVVIIMLVTPCLLLSSCGGGGDDPQADKQAEVKAKLTAGTWKTNNVMVDGVDRTSVYTTFTVKFEATSYTITNGGGIWSNSGSQWSFTNSEATMIAMNGLSVTLNEVSDTALKFSVNSSKATYGPGRVSGVRGDHVFTMGK